LNAGVPMADRAPTSNRFWNVPNTLTLSRLALAVVVFALISYGFYFGALVVFAVAAVTDALDGYFARLLNQESPIGRQLDPLIDKVIVAGTYVYLLTLGIRETGVYPWMVTTIIVRELLIQGLRSLLEGQGHPFGARQAGKLKTVFQCLSICAVLACLWLQPSDGWLWGRDVLTWAAVGLTVYSGFVYVAVGMPWLKRDAGSAPGA
jgi:CDP-diacylglycerol--glycerol-3-phosphate 3-phosphatidyltransferase